MAMPARSQDSWPGFRGLGQAGIGGAVPGLDRHMPTAPRVTKALGDGRFQIDGVKFDMAGRWRLRLRIDADGVSDSVEFDILVK